MKQEKNGINFDQQYDSFIIIQKSNNQMFYYPIPHKQQIQPITWYYFQEIPQTNIAKYPIQNNPYLQINSFFRLLGQQTTDINSSIQKYPQNVINNSNECMLKSHSCKNKKIQNNNQENYDDEEQFKPSISEHRKCRKTPQNANRNVIPNIMHQVISFLQKRNKSQNLVKKLINKLEISQICSVKRFYLYQLLVKDKLNHYVNVESLKILKELQEPNCQVYTQQEQINYNLISRLLVQYFLAKEFDTMILTSKRVNSDKKLDHLLTKRKILQQISKMFTD